MKNQIKYCSRCKENKNVIEYASHNTKGFQSHCKECQRDEKRIERKNHYDRVRTRERKNARALHEKNAELLYKLKDRPCKDCEKQYWPWQMDFNHVKGIKEFSIDMATVKDFSKQRILLEVSKCEIVCANCHSDKTLKDIVLSNEQLQVIIANKKFIWSNTLNSVNSDDLKKMSYSRAHYLANLNYYREKRRFHQRRTNAKAKLDLRKFKDRECLDCQEKYPFWVMQFDHLEEKLLTIGKSRGLSPERMVKEAAKCDVVCTCCHRLRSFIRGIVAAGYQIPSPKIGYPSLPNLGTIVGEKAVSFYDDIQVDVLDL
jgi:hypothetical protein